MLSVRSFLASVDIGIAHEVKQPGDDQLGVLVDWIRSISISGPIGLVLFYLMQVVAIIGCFPCSSTFDYSAGALFGFLPGLVMVVLGKGTAAVLTFKLVRGVSSSPIGRWVQNRAARRGADGSRWATTTARLHESVQQGGVRFCILLRLSPLPSWVASYVLSLTGVPFPVYAASMIGMAPPLVANVYQGFAAASIAGSWGGTGGRHGRRDGTGLLLLAAFQWLMGLVLAQQMAKLALQAGPEPESHTSSPELLGPGLDDQDAQESMAPNFLGCSSPNSQEGMA